MDIIVLEDDTINAEILSNMVVTNNQFKVALVLGEEAEMATQLLLAKEPRQISQTLICSEIYICICSFLLFQNHIII